MMSEIECLSKTWKSRAPKNRVSPLLFSTSGRRDDRRRTSSLDAIDATRPGPHRYTTFLSSFNEEMKISNVVLADKTVLNSA